MTPPLRDLRFRTSPCIELKLLGELEPAQREPFLELERDPDFYGLLIAKPPLTMNLKSVVRSTATLLQSLIAPSHLDAAAIDDDVVDLVLDGILEIEHGDDFISGADALSLVCPPREATPTRDAAARLSHDALLHAQDLETNDAQTLTAALYFFNRIPLTPFWRARFADADAILAHLGADRGTLRALLEREWIASRRMAGWLTWSTKSPSRRTPESGTYKLYISPRPERMRDAFDVVVRVLADYPGTPFKIGNGAAGMLRPDQMVAYFPTREELNEVADVLRRELAGCDAHGVPFSAGLDDTGLLSWGVDPPDADRALQWLRRESWRFWVAQRLGAAVSIAKIARGAAAIEPWRFAIERVRRHGVDVDTWTPSATLWSRP
jgi:hypothetical protein